MLSRMRLHATIAAAQLAANANLQTHQGGPWCLPDGLAAGSCNLRILQRTLSD